MMFKSIELEDSSTKHRVMRNDEKKQIIARGQFCDVIKVINDVTGMVHAVKSTFLDDQRAPHDAWLELKLLKELDSPSIIHVHKSIHETSGIDDTLDVYMDYLPFTLTQYLLNFGCKANFPTPSNPSKWRNVLPFKNALRVSEQIALGISYLHANGIIHRDIKSENVLFAAEDARPVIIDLDVAWKKGYNEDELDEPIIHDVGTACYRAPELLFGLKYSFSLDIWGLGCLIWKIYTSDPTNDLFSPYTSDISLISHQFDRLGMPSEEEWPQAMDESEVFKSMVRNRPVDQKLRLLASDHHISDLLRQMLVFQASHRPTAAQVAQCLQTIQNHELLSK